MKIADKRIFIILFLATMACIHVWIYVAAIKAAKDPSEMLLFPVLAHALAIAWIAQMVRKYPREEESSES